MKYYLIIVLIALVSCQGRPDMVVKTEENNGDKVDFVSADNEAMNAAIQEAVRNYPLFERAMQQPDSSLSEFSVKMKFTYDGGNKEHMWVSELHMIGGQLFGVLNSDPLHVKGLELGDTLRVTRDDISDWMYVKNGKLQGGYTIKALYNNMNEKEKMEFRQSFPFEIE